MNDNFYLRHTYRGQSGLVCTYCGEPFWNKPGTPPVDCLPEVEILVEYRRLDPPEAYKNGFRKQHRPSRPPIIFYRIWPNKEIQIFDLREPRKGWYETGGVNTDSAWWEHISKYAYVVAEAHVLAYIRHHSEARN